MGVSLAAELLAFPGVFVTDYLGNNPFLPAQQLTYTGTGEIGVIVAVKPNLFAPFPYGFAVEAP